MDVIERVGVLKMIIALAKEISAGEMDVMVKMDVMEEMGVMEEMDVQDIKDQLVPLDLRDQLEHQIKQDHPVHKEILVLRVQKDQ
jgi:hypothetical protein